MKRTTRLGSAAGTLLLCAGLASKPALRAQNTAAAPTSAAAMVRFAFGGNVAQLPAQFDDNLVFVPVRVNQGQPSMFQLDTSAAVSSIDPARAAELGVANLRSPVLNLTDVDFSLAQLGSQTNNDFGPRLGRGYEGTIGNDMLSGAVIEIDYGRQTVRLYDPASYHYKGAGKGFPLTMRDGMPAVRAKVDVAGRKSGEALFVINTALDVPLLISDRFANQRHFFSSHLKTVPLASGELGVGGKAVLGRVEYFEIGPYQIQAPLAAFAEGPLPGDDSQIAGEIGGGMLRRFTVTLDYASHLAYFDGNSEIHADDHEDMSGISIAATGPGWRTLEVVQVRPGSPGADAGVQKGDLIEGVDDEAAADISVTSARELFRNVGHRYKLLINRDGKTMTINVTMHRAL
ncbi:MAG TPA: PDZ domain-containing protein [Candidatus Acidoferrales bacterium]|nr:PDZ domain-containing protein [Candidatus Acidoferrales bacterium]